MNKLDYHAKLLIHDLPAMNKRTIGRLVDWLRATAKEIAKEDKRIFARRFRARLMK